MQDKYNPLWKQFGCNEHDFLLFGVGKGWNSEGFVNWLTKWGAEYPGVLVDASSPLYTQIFGPWGGAANSGLYIVKPDRTFSAPKSKYLEHLFSLDVQEYDCDATEIDSEFSVGNKSLDKFIISNKTITFSNPNKGEVFFSIYSLNGKLLTQSKKQIFPAGINSFTFENISNLTKGTYIVKKNNGNNSSSIVTILK